MFHKANINDNQPTTIEPTVSKKATLVSLPLIIVTESAWDIYFAYDRRTHIDIYRLLRIGSIESIDDTYTLLCSLEAVKDWIETTFYQSIKEWF